jgi:uncharacterized membrane protein (UPF0127 family)
MATIVNLTRQSTVCQQAQIADRPLCRMRGLLGRRSLPAGEKMLLRPWPSVDTAFMRLPIDVAFLDADMQVLRVVPELKPWRAASYRRSRAVPKMAAGEAARRGIEPGDHFELAEPK